MTDNELISVPELLQEVETEINRRKKLNSIEKNYLAEWKINSRKRYSETLEHCQIELNILTKEFKGKGICLYDISHNYYLFHIVKYLASRDNRRNENSNRYRGLI